MEHNHTARYRAKAVVETIRTQGRSVAWLARQIGLSRQYTSDVVHGNIDVRRDVAQRIAVALGVPLFLAFDVSSGTISTHIGDHLEAAVA